jgi:hypothetical protein
VDARTSNARSRKSRNIENSAGSVQPLLLVKYLKNKLITASIHYYIAAASNSRNQLGLLFERLQLSLPRYMVAHQYVLDAYLVPGALKAFFIVL